THRRGGGAVAGHPGPGRNPPPPVPPRRRPSPAGLAAPGAAPPKPAHPGGLPPRGPPAPPPRPPPPAPTRPPPPPSNGPGPPGPAPQLLPAGLVPAEPARDAAPRGDTSPPSLLLVGDVDFGAAPGTPPAEVASRAGVRGTALPAYAPLPGTRGEVLAVRDS